MGGGLEITFEDESVKEVAGTMDLKHIFELREKYKKKYQKKVIGHVARWKLGSAIR